MKGLLKKVEGFFWCKVCVKGKLVGNANAAESLVYSEDELNVVGDS